MPTTFTTDLPKPSNVDVSPSGSSYSVTWTDNSSNEDGFRVYHRTSGGTYSTISVSANTTSATINDIPKNSLYEVYVESYTEHTQSQSSVYYYAINGQSASSGQATLNSNSSTEADSGINNILSTLSTHSVDSSISTELLDTTVGGLIGGTEQNTLVIENADFTQSSILSSSESGIMIESASMLFNSTEEFVESGNSDSNLSTILRSLTDTTATTQATNKSVHILSVGNVLLEAADGAQSELAILEQSIQTIYDSEETSYLAEETSQTLRPLTVLFGNNIASENLTKPLESRASTELAETTNLSSLLKNVHEITPWTEDSTISTGKSYLIANSNLNIQEISTIQDLSTLGVVTKINNLESAIGDGGGSITLAVTPYSSEQNKITQKLDVDASVSSFVVEQLVDAYETLLNNIEAELSLLENTLLLVSLSDIGTNPTVSGEFNSIAFDSTSISGLVVVDGMTSAASANETPYIFADSNVSLLGHSVELNTFVRVKSASDVSDLDYNSTIEEIKYSDASSEIDYL